jgi:hypothetical protein
MAVGLVMNFPGMTAEIYDGINQEIGFPGDVPDGLISHVAGPSDGGFRIVDTWESRDKFDTFVQEKIGPAMQKVPGAADVPPPDPEQFEVHNRYPS